MEMGEKVLWKWEKKYNGNGRKSIMEMGEKVLWKWEKKYNGNGRTFFLLKWEKKYNGNERTVKNKRRGVEKIREGRK